MQMLCQPWGLKLPQMRARRAAANALSSAGLSRTFAALDLGEFVDNLPAAAVEMHGDRRVQAKP